MGTPPTMPTLTAATKSRTGDFFNAPNFTSWRRAEERAICAPVMAAQRVPPSA